MELNASKTKIVSRSRTIHPQSPLLSLGRTVLQESDDLHLLEVTFDSEITFRKTSSALRALSRASSIFSFFS